MFLIQICLLFLVFTSALKAENAVTHTSLKKGNKVVIGKKRIQLENFPGAYNPSIIEHGDGYLLTFRYVPNSNYEPWVSKIGIVELDIFFEPCSEPELLHTRFGNEVTPSQSEDARIFKYNNRIYVVYNDNLETIHLSQWDRRDMYMAEICELNNHYSLVNPVKLVHETDYERVLCQKNWTPIEWQGKLLFLYSIQPHEILKPDLEKGICRIEYKSTAEDNINWFFGPIRGGTPPCLVDGEYLAFFHSGIVTSSPSSNHNYLWHYFMGAYTFSAEPPFEMTALSTQPIDCPGFYTKSDREKRVIYPGGFIVKEGKAYVAYGKDDCEMWIAIIDLKELKKTMTPVTYGASL